MFRNREEAGRLLAWRLQAYRDDPTALVIALPRGGVVVGFTLSRELRLPLDVFLVRKLGAPECPEYALGAVTETGFVYLNPLAVSLYEGRKVKLKEYLEAAIRRQRQEIARRQALYRSGRSLPRLTDRTVLLVDDGVATGATFLASVESLRSLPVKRLVAALPVAPPDVLGEIRKRVDQLVVLDAPEEFDAVGAFYLDFGQVEDEDVVRLLAEAASFLREVSH